jgi:H+/Cl- antiporter ClcA
MVLRKAMAQRRSDLDDALWSGHGELSWRRSIISGLLSEIAVGAGASLGREAAPKLAGGATASVLARWAKLTVPQRRLLVACGGGAGMAAIYNVPLGGALLTAEVLYGSLSLSVVLPAVACSVVATATSWLFLPDRPAYPRIPAYDAHPQLLVWVLIAGPVLGLLSVGWVRLVGFVSAKRPRGWWLLLSITTSFSVTGLIAWHYPQLLGNGKSLAAVAFLGIGVGSAGMLLVLAALKPLVTALCLGSGATGGLFTPTMSIGALLGAAGGIGFSHLWAGAAVGSFAIVGAAAMVGAATQAPLAGLVLVAELTGDLSLMVPMAGATALATIVARYLDGYSIYSARLPPL